MRIESASSRAVSKRTSARGGSKSGQVFQATHSSPSAGSSANGAVISSAGIDSILALQGIEDPLFSKKRALSHGQSLLDALEEMKGDLLAGHVGESRLNRLMALVTRARQKADPDLDALIDDIDLRARVELAKLGRFTE